MLFYEILKAIVLGITEGITEWLPISSTGHMILLDEFLRLDVSGEFLSMFLVVIQLGAICAVPILFWDRINPFSVRKTSSEKKQILDIWGKVLVGSIPAAMLGLLLDDILDKYLYNFVVVAIALIIYGIAFIFAEKSRAEAKNAVKSIDSLTYVDALKIGAFQSLSLVPGTSRSGSTILGGMLIGVSREISAEFSFFIAIPIMLGASTLKVVKFLISGFTATSNEILLLSIGLIVSFIVSIFAIRFIMDYVKHHDFKLFGYYRIILGLVILIYFLIKYL